MIRFSRISWADSPLPAFMLVLGIEKDCIADGFGGSVGRFEFVAKEIGDVEDVKGTGDGGGIGGIQNVIDRIKNYLNRLFFSMTIPRTFFREKQK